jgi:ParB family chromosome partitioning protein
MKRDLLFVVERLTTMLDERRLVILARQHGLGKQKNGESLAKLVSAFLPKAEESTLGRLMLERDPPVRAFADGFRQGAARGCHSI